MKKARIVAANMLVRGFALALFALFGITAGAGSILLLRLLIVVGNAILGELP